MTHVSDTVLLALNSDDDYPFKSKILQVHMVPFFFQKMGTSFLKQKLECPFLDKKMDPCGPGRFSSLLFSLRRVRTTSAIATHFCSTLRHILERILPHATLLKTYKFTWFIFSQNMERLFLYKTWSAPVLIKRWNHMGLQILSTWNFRWTLYAWWYLWQHMSVLFSNKYLRVWDSRTTIWKIRVRMAPSLFQNMERPFVEKKMDLRKNGNVQQYSTCT